MNLMQLGLDIQAASIGKGPLCSFHVSVTAPDFATTIKVTGVEDESEAVDEARRIVATAFPALAGAVYEVLHGY